MKECNLQNNNENTPVNDNDNTCLKAIPYEVALQQNGWGELKPIATALLPVEPFHVAQVPLTLSRYIYDIADRQQAPLDFIAVSALCGFAALIGNGVHIAPKQYDDWKIVPNLWGALIGQPSTMKTPTMQAALAPITRLQKQWYKEWLKQKENQEIEEILETLDKSEKKKQAHKAIKKGDLETARALLSEAPSKDNIHDDSSRFIVNDTSVEKLGELLKENPRGLLMVRDELSGFLTNLERKEYQTDRAFYLEAFNGDGQFTYDRIGRGTIFIPNATLSIIGGIQPSRILPFYAMLYMAKAMMVFYNGFKCWCGPMIQKIGNGLIDTLIKKHGKLMKGCFMLFMINPLVLQNTRLSCVFLLMLKRFFVNGCKRFLKKLKGITFLKAYNRIF